MSQTVSVDARGRSCPEPVILTRQALSGFKSGKLTVLVDAAVARDNVTRALKTATGKEPHIAETGLGEWEISVTI